MGVSTTHRIYLPMWILIYSFSGTYYVWVACGILQQKNYVVYWCWSRARDECTPSYKKSWIRPCYIWPRATMRPLWLLIWLTHEVKNCLTMWILFALLTPEKLIESQWGYWKGFCLKTISVHIIFHWNNLGFKCCRWVCSKIWYMLVQLHPTKFGRNTFD